jgi:hypothetical protein
MKSPDLPEEQFMFDFLRNLFKKKSGKPSPKTHPNVSQADEIRKYAKMHFIIPARQRKEPRVTFTAKDIHQGMDLASRYPLVCAAIDAKKFKEFARVELTKRDGPNQGATARWTFKILS